MALIDTNAESAAAPGVRAFRAILSLNGVGLLAATAGLWLLPGSNLSAEVVPLKLGLSVFMLFAALWLLSQARPPQRT